jgi:3-(3-hydroxy-phenyl)propionate hydroxylase
MAETTNAGRAGCDNVMVAGAGPVGCVAALHLARHGLHVTLIEAEPEPVMDLRASTFHPPTLDMLDDLDLTQSLIPQGLVAAAFQYRQRQTGNAAKFDLSAIADLTRHPYRLQCEQWKLTQEALRMLQEMPNVTLVTGARLEHIEQDANGVTAHVESPEHGFAQYRGQFLIGCDGGNSRVRRSMATTFRGFTYPERFLVVSSAFDFASTNAGLCAVNYVWDPAQWYVLLRTPTLWRLLIPTPPTLADGEVLSDAFIQKKLQPLAGSSGPVDVIHRSLYKVHQRVADRWRQGRLLLAGDACHLNNPLGGMGMNGGIHDAVSAAQSVEAILLDGAQFDVLDRYERSRRGVCVRFVQAQSIRNKQDIENSDPQAQLLRHDALMRTAADASAAREYMIQQSMIGSLREAAAIQ